MFASYKLNNSKIKVGKDYLEVPGIGGKEGGRKEMVERAGRRRRN